MARKDRSASLANIFSSNFLPIPRSPKLSDGDASLYSLSSSMNSVASGSTFYVSCAQDIQETVEPESLCVVRDNSKANQAVVIKELKLKLRDNKTQILAKRDKLKGSDWSLDLLKENWDNFVDWRHDVSEAQDHFEMNASHEFVGNNKMLNNKISARRNSNSPNCSPNNIDPPNIAEHNSDSPKSVRSDIHEYRSKQQKGNEGRRGSSSIVSGLPPLARSSNLRLRTNFQSHRTKVSPSHTVTNSIYERTEERTSLRVTSLSRLQNGVNNKSQNGSHRPLQRTYGIAGTEKIFKRQNSLFGDLGLSFSRDFSGNFLP